jgi:hypothetical protein
VTGQVLVLTRIAGMVPAADNTDLKRKIGKLLREFDPQIDFAADSFRNDISQLVDLENNLLYFLCYLFLNLTFKISMIIINHVSKMARNTLP